MSEVIRDVVVRITLEQIQAAIKVPDISAYKTVGEEAKKVPKSVKEEHAKAAKAIKLEDAETTADLKQSIKEISEANEKAVRNDVELKKKQAAESKKLADQAAAAAEREVNAKLRVLEATKQLGTGTFQLARGVAFLTTSSDENFQKMLQTIAKFQGGFDIISGGADTIKGLVEGTRALKVAYGAASVAAAVQAAAQSTVAATAGAATAAVTALKVALGPIGLIITGIGVGVAALAAGWKVLTSEQSKTAQVMPKMTEEQKKIVTELERELQLRSELRSIEQSTENQKIALLNDENKLAALREQTKEGKIRLDQLKGEVDLAKRFVGEQQKAFEENEARRRSSLNLLRTGGFLDRVTGIGRATGGARDASEFDTSRQQTEILDKTRQQSEIAKQILENTKQEASLKEKVKETANAQLEKERQLVAEAQKGVAASKEKLALEERKLQSIEAQFGALSKAEQIELKSLADKVKAGEELNRIELQRAQQLGGDLTRDFVQQQQAKAGRAAGASDVGAAFGANINAGVEQARAGINEAVRKQAEAEANAAIAQAELTRATAAFEETTALLSGLIENAGELGKRVKELEKILEENKANSEE